jgi:apoptosis-inducing factor 3
MADKIDPALPDLAKGIPAATVTEGQCVRGRVGEEEVVLVRSGNELFAIGSHCTHYHGPLADGLVVGDTIRCPWHHACFNLRTGEAVRAPALDPVSCFRVGREGDQLFVRDKIEEPRPPARSAREKAVSPASIVIVGGGAAGLAAADMLRREGYDGPVTMISSDTDPPVDRPNLSKDYLAGQAQEDWMPLRPSEFYTDRHIELLLETHASSLEPVGRTIRLSDGSQRSFGALLIATGADPVRLPIPGAETANVHYLRSFADSRAIVAKAESGTRAVVVGASFIGLEVAASLRARGVAVHVVGPEQVPLEKTMGREVGRFVQSLHEAKGVVFHLGQTVARLSSRAATLSNGENLEADFVVIGAGVRPSTELAERAGLKIDRGILVNEFLETSASGIFAAGDVARWPDPYTGERIRVEHWVVGERQGQVAARNMLGRRERFDAVPFFWSQHYDVTINYVGHAEKWDAVRIDGTMESHDCAITYTRQGRTLAVATIFRDRQSLQAEVEMEREISAMVRKQNVSSTI